MIVYAELAATLRTLHEQPEVRERLRAEVLANAPLGPSVRPNWTRCRTSCKSSTR